MSPPLPEPSLLQHLAKPLILLVFGGSLLFMAVRRMRRYRLKERYTLLLVLSGTPFFILAAWPTGMAWLSTQLGIDYRTVVVLCVFAFLILMIFELLTIVSLQDRKLTTLAQLVGIMMQKQGLGEQEEALVPGRDAEPARDILHD